ncbi:MAG: hypothetical protein S4CHLAM2_11650 [Chlamydiales bacterium]|nr:hypothetical protein [Chlamydiales bacterium]
MGYKKLVYGFLVSCCLIQPNLFGSGNEISCDPYCSLTNACEQLACACEELSGRYEENYNTTYLPMEKCCYWGVINFYAEYLWWKIHQEGLHYAVSGVQNNVPGEGRLFALEGDWDSGFRIGAGIFFPCNSWRLNLDWLSLRNEDMDAVQPSGLVLRATRGHPGDIDVITSAVADMTFKLDSIRLSLDIPIFTRTHVAITPSIGLRNDSIRETFEIVYTGTESGRFRNSIQYCGLGPQVGLNAAWYLLPCFAVCGDLGVAGLYGSCDIHQQTADNDTDEDSNFRYRPERLQSTFNSTLGVQWEGSFFRNIYLRLKLGWETNIWFNFNTLYSFTSIGEEGNLVNVANDLRTSGITFRGTLSF